MANLFGGKYPKQSVCKLTLRHRSLTRHTLGRCRLLLVDTPGADGHRRAAITRPYDKSDGALTFVVDMFDV